MDSKLLIRNMHHSKDRLVVLSKSVFSVMKNIHSLSKRWFLLFSLVFVSSVFSFPKNVTAESISIQTLPESLFFSWENESEEIPQEILNSWFTPTNTLQFKKNTQTEAVSPRLCPWRDFFCTLSLTENIRYSLHSTTSYTLEETFARNFLESIRIRSRKTPIDALFTANTDGVISAFAPSRDGAEIDIESGLKTLKSSLASSKNKNLSIPLSFVILRPTITSTDADRLGITQFLGEGRTNFAGSPKNRIFNINRAIEQFQGVLIPPGEEFSFVTRLGEVDGEHGYLPELVIKRGKTTPEFGGGICQVSTTLFRAAINTGQKITERRNHAYPVSYYKPYGMDATIYIPKPDFKFVNNTPAHILIQVAIEEKELVFRFYGTPDNRTVEIDGPHITARTPDGGMKTIFTQTVRDKTGAVMIQDDFRSSYESPDKYPHPGEEKLTEKPKNWSEKQWNDYGRTGALPR